VVGDKKLKIEELEGENKQKESYRRWGIVMFHWL